MLAPAATLIGRSLPQPIGLLAGGDFARMGFTAHLVSTQRAIYAHRYEAPSGSHPFPHQAKRWKACRPGSSKDDFIAWARNAMALEPDANIVPQLASHPDDLSLIVQALEKVERDHADKQVQQAVNGEPVEGVDDGLIF